MMLSHITSTPRRYRAFCQCIFHMPFKWYPNYVELGSVSALASSFPACSTCRDTSPTQQVGNSDSLQRPETKIPQFIKKNNIIMDLDEKGKDMPELQIFH